MTWKKIVFSSADVAAGAEVRLLEAFSNKLVHTPGAHPVRSYVRSDDVTKEDTVFFDPAAVGIGGALLDQYGAVDCPEPDPPGLEVFAQRV